ncbi:MAG: hypothetical protein NXH95_13645 [Pseudomonadaceae bacterium]|nr:hypothetical protein [Pseudomonadaceae bacterium]
MPDRIDFNGGASRFRVRVNGVVRSSHTTEREAAQNAANFAMAAPHAEVNYYHDYEVGVSFLRVTSVPEASAVVQVFDAQGNPAGYGPADDPAGVFFGRGDLQQGDIWSVVSVGPGQTVTPLEGGSFLVNTSGSFDWELRRSGVVVDSGTKTVTVT